MTEHLAHNRIQPNRFVPILAKALSSAGAKSDDARIAVYQRARQALRKLEVDIAPNQQGHVTAQQSLLEEAIAWIEADLLQKAGAADDRTSNHPAEPYLTGSTETVKPVGAAQQRDSDQSTIQRAPKAIVDPRQSGDTSNDAAGLFSEAPTLPDDDVGEPLEASKPKKFGVRLAFVAAIFGAVYLLLNLQDVRRFALERTGQIAPVVSHQQLVSESTPFNALTAASDEHPRLVVREGSEARTATGQVVSHRGGSVLSIDFDTENVALELSARAGVAERARGVNLQFQGERANVLSIGQANVIAKSDSGTVSFPLVTVRVGGERFVLATDPSVSESLANHEQIQTLAIELVEVALSANTSVSLSVPLPEGDLADALVLP